MIPSDVQDYLDGVNTRVRKVVLALALASDHPDARLEGG